jgi:hypothetical protein
MDRVTLALLYNDADELFSFQKEIVFHFLCDRGRRVWWRDVWIRGK